MSEMARFVSPLADWKRGGMSDTSFLWGRFQCIGVGSGHLLLARNFPTGGTIDEILLCEMPGPNLVHCDPLLQVCLQVVHALEVKWIAANDQLLRQRPTAHTRCAWRVPEVGAAHFVLDVLDLVLRLLLLCLRPHDTWENEHGWLAFNRTSLIIRNAWHTVVKGQFQEIPSQHL